MPTGDSAPTLKDVLRARQTARNRKACLPCRERKVRCDREHPCITCSKRGHADLCRYEEASASLQDLSSGAMQGGTPRTRQHPSNEESTGIVSQQDEGFRTRIPPIQSSPGLEGPPTGSSLLGEGSFVAMTGHGSAQPSDDPDRQMAFETGLLPLLGMGGTAIADSSDASSEEHRSLPNDRDMVSLFELYRHRVHPFHSITFDLDQIEKTMCFLVENRFELSQPPCGPRFLCLLHAIMATGAQFSDLPLKQRTSLSQKHVKHAFELLRTADYLSRPCKTTLQTLLLLGNVLQNDMRPQAAWALGGTTIRLALSLGIQKQASRYASSPLSPQEAGSLRMAIVWQDVLLSLAFDRSPTSYEMDHHTDLPAAGTSEGTGGLTYRQAMNWLCHVTLRYLSSRASREIAAIFQFFQDIDLIDASLAPHLRDRGKSYSVQAMQEHCSFELHKNFSLSTLCRPFVSSKTRPTIDETTSNMLLERFQASLKRSAWAFIRLRRIMGYARRSWAFVHNGLASALLLSFMKETRNTSETRQIQSRLIESLMEGEQDAASESGLTNVDQLSDTHRKALRALQSLKRLAEDDSIAKMPDENGPINDNIPVDVGSQQAGHADKDLPSQFLWDGQDMNGSVDMDELLRSFDFDSFSPSDVFDLVMPDANISGMG